MLVIVLFLMQLLQGMMGGGNTPQKGAAEEQPNFNQPSSGSRFRGGGSNTQEGAGSAPGLSASPKTSPWPSSVPPTSLSLEDLHVVLSSSTNAVPSAITLRREQDVLTVSNGATSTLTVGLRRPGETVLLERDILSNSAHHFQFTMPGIYELVVGTNTLVTVTVQ